MPRVHHVKKARKDNPAVKRGDPYYYWEFRYGPKRYSATPPRPSQLTQSHFLSASLELQERIGDLTTEDDLEAARDEIAGEIDNLRDETQDSFDNMPEGLQQGDTGQLLEGRVEALEQWQQELEGLEFDIDEDDVAADAEDDEEREEAIEAAKQERLDELQAIEPYLE